MTVPSAGDTTTLLEGAGELFGSTAAPPPLLPIIGATGAPPCPDAPSAATGTVTSLQTVVDVVLGAVPEAGVLEMV